MATPIFVLGKHRSGTTWVANQLCLHPAVTGVTHPAHFGIKESFFFSHFDGRYGDLGRPRNHRRLVEEFGASDYCSLAGIPDEQLASLESKSYAAFFRSLMDEFARRRGADFWVEKTPLHTLLCGRLHGFYPDALFVGVQRNIADVVASTMQMEDWRDPLSARSKSMTRRICAMALDYAVYRDTLERFAGKHDRFLLVDYEDLCSDLRGRMEKICAFLGIRFDEAVLAKAFEKNTRFSSDSRRWRPSPGQEILMGTVAALCRLMPLLARLVRAIHIRHWRRGPLPRTCFTQQH
jgi:hypothetical protein